MFTIMGVEFTGEHARLLVVVLGGLFTTLGYVAGSWTKHRRHRKFRREDLVGSTVVTELYGFYQHSDGLYLHIVSQGGSKAIEDVFTNQELIAHIERASKRHPGLLKLADPIAHRMMMDEGKDNITGLDPAANADFLLGRPTRDDDVLFGFGAYQESGDRRNGLHDEVGRLVQMVVALGNIERLADPVFIASVKVPHAGYKPRVDRLHAFAKEWQRLETLPHEQRHAATDKIWKVTLRTSLHGPDV